MPKNQHTTTHSDLFALGVSAWAKRIRAGKLTFTETIEQSFNSIEENAYIDAFECLDKERALATASAMDALLASGTDLGPLMGMPLGVKDIIAVSGLPTHNGSNTDSSALSGEAGQLINTLLRAGVVVVGKTKTVEFAFGATGVNASRGTPWNPADRTVHRITGGSSSGSAAAVAAGFVGMALGSDTGGSIRNPACLTGTVGHKTTVGLWPTDGIFPLSRTLDSAGPLCRTVADAALIHHVVTGQLVDARPSVVGLRFGVPQTLFMDDLDTKVKDDFERSIQALLAAGAVQVEFDFPEALEREYLFPDIVAPELIATLTPAFFDSIRDHIDPVTAFRAEHGLRVSAIDYLNAQKRRLSLSVKAAKTFNQLDCWITPTCPIVAPALADLQKPSINKMALQASRNTQPGNLFNLCGMSLPMHKHGLPTGLQILMPEHTDTQLLSVALAVENELKK